MKNYLVILALFFAVSCADESSTPKPQQTPLSVDERVDALVKSIQPVFASLREKTTSKEDMYLISYEVAMDTETGELTLLNFQSEDLFPIAGREEYARIAADKYVVECVNGGKKTSTSCDGQVSCGKAISACLESGGCATICQAPKPYKTIQDDDLRYFEGKGVETSLLKTIVNLPTINLDKSKSQGTLTSVKLYSLIE